MTKNRKGVHWLITTAAILVCILLPVSAIAAESR